MPQTAYNEHAPIHCAANVHCSGFFDTQSLMSKKVATEKSGAAHTVAVCTARKGAWLASQALRGQLSIAAALGSP